MTGLLQSIITKELPESTRHKGLIDMCRTRWAARHTAYTHFYQAHLYIITTLENIAYGANRELCGKDYQDAVWDLKSKGDAIAMLGSLTSFDFIVSFLVLYEFLSHMSGITVKLQDQSVDIIKAYQEVLEIVLYNNIYFLSTVLEMYHN